MDLIPKTEAQKIAERINQIQGDLSNHAVKQLEAIHSLVNTPGLQQGVLDAFGTNGVAALTAYGAFHAALAVAAPGNAAPAPNISVFQPQQDGTILYVAPPAPPEPEPEPEPEPPAE